MKFKIGALADEIEWDERPDDGCPEHGRAFLRCDRAFRKVRCEACGWSGPVLPRYLVGR